MNYEESVSEKDEDDFSSHRFSSDSGSLESDRSKNSGSEDSSSGIESSIITESMQDSKSLDHSANNAQFRDSMQHL